MHVPSTPLGGSQPHGTNLGGEEVLPGLVKLCKDQLQLKHMLFFRSDLAGSRQDRYQLVLGIG